VGPTRLSERHRHHDAHDRPFGPGWRDYEEARASFFAALRRDAEITASRSCVRSRLFARDGGIGRIWFAWSQFHPETVVWTPLAG
jgi:hypothetical protein